MSEAIFADAEADWDELPPVNRHERRANAVGVTRGEMERKVRYEDLPPTAIITHKDLPPGAKYSRTHQYRLVAAGLFPKKVRLSPGRTGWLKADVDHWIRTRPTVEPGERTVSEATRQKLRPLGGEAAPGGRAAVGRGQLMAAAKRRRRPVTKGKFRFKVWVKAH